MNMIILLLVYLINHSLSAMHLSPQQYPPTTHEFLHNVFNNDPFASHNFLVAQQLLYNNYGDQQEYKENRRQAKNIFLSIIHNQSPLADLAHHELAKLSLKKQDHNGAFNHLEQTSFPLAQYFLAQLYEQENETRQALDHYKIAAYQWIIHRPILNKNGFWLLDYKNQPIFKPVVYTHKPALKKILSITDDPVEKIKTLHGLIATTYDPQEKLSYITQITQLQAQNIALYQPTSAKSITPTQEEQAVRNALASAQQDDETEKRQGINELKNILITHRLTPEHKQQVVQCIQDNAHCNIELLSYCLEQNALFPAAHLLCQSFDFLKQLNRYNRPSLQAFLESTALSKTLDYLEHAPAQEIIDCYAILGYLFKQADDVNHGAELICMALNKSIEHNKSSLYLNEAIKSLTSLKQCELHNNTIKTIHLLLALGPLSQESTTSLSYLQNHRTDLADIAPQTIEVVLNQLKSLAAYNGHAAFLLYTLYTEGVYNVLTPNKQQAASYFQKAQRLNDPQAAYVAIKNNKNCSSTDWLQFIEQWQSVPDTRARQCIASARRELQQYALQNDLPALQYLAHYYHQTNHTLAFQETAQQIVHHHNVALSYIDDLERLLSQREEPFPSLKIALSDKKALLNPTRANITAAITTPLSYLTTTTDATDAHEKTKLQQHFHQYAQHQTGFETIVELWPYNNKLQHVFSLETLLSYPHNASHAMVFNDHTFATLYKLVETDNTSAVYNQFYHWCRRHNQFFRLPNTSSKQYHRLCHENHSNEEKLTIIKEIIEQYQNNATDNHYLKEIIAELEKLAHQLPAAKNYLAQLHQEGLEPFITKNDNTALKLFKQAHKQGYKNALIGIAKIQSAQSLTALSKETLSYYQKAYQLAQNINDQTTIRLIRTTLNQMCRHGSYDAGVALFALDQTCQEETLKNLLGLLSTPSQKSDSFIAYLKQHGQMKRMKNIAQDNGLAASLLARAYLQEAHGGTPIADPIDHFFKYNKCALDTFAKAASLLDQSKIYQKNIHEENNQLQREAKADIAEMLCLKHNWQELKNYLTFVQHHRDPEAFYNLIQQTIFDAKAHPILLQTLMQLALVNDSAALMLAELYETHHPLTEKITLNLDTLKQRLQQPSTSSFRAIFKNAVLKKLFDHTDDMVPLQQDLHKKAANNDPEALYLLGVNAYIHNDYQQAANYLEQSRNFETTALRSLGMMSLNNMKQSEYQRAFDQAKDFLGYITTLNTHDSHELSFIKERLLANLNRLGQHKIIEAYTPLITYYFEQFAYTKEMKWFSFGSVRLAEQITLLLHAETSAEVLNQKLKPFQQYPDAITNNEDDAIRFIKSAIYYHAVCKNISVFNEPYDCHNYLNKAHAYFKKIDEHNQFRTALVDYFSNLLLQLLNTLKDTQHNSKIINTIIHDLSTIDGTKPALAQFIFMYYLGNSAPETGKKALNQALSMLKTLSDKNNDHAALLLFHLYNTGGALKCDAKIKIDTKKAKHYLLRACSLHNAQAKRYKADALLNGTLGFKKDDKAAIKEYDELIQTGHFKALMKKAQALIARKQFDEALKCLNDPRLTSEPSVLAYKADAFLYLYEREKKNTYFDEAIRCFNNNLDMLEQLYKEDPTSSELREEWNELAKSHVVEMLKQYSDESLTDLSDTLALAIGRYAKDTAILSYGRLQKKVTDCLFLETREKFLEKMRCHRNPLVMLQGYHYELEILFFSNKRDLARKKLEQDAPHLSSLLKHTADLPQQLKNDLKALIVKIITQSKNTNTQQIYEFPEALVQLLNIL